MARKRSETDLPVRTAEFNASVGQEQLSYICAYCGKVNPIAAGKCLRCGKRRPRSEYLNALNRTRQTNDFRETLSSEMAQAEFDRKEAQDMQLARLVEERVADEKAQIQALETAKREQDREAVQRLAARDAALRVIEAERRADDAERRAQEAVDGKNRETEEMLRIEREKAMYAAAQKVVSERMGIEQAAEERINIARSEMQKEANKALADSVEAIEKDAARRAVMKIISAEQSTEDRIRLERAAASRRTEDKIKEERERIREYESARYEAEKEGIQRAVEERIRAEREIFGKGDGVQSGAPGTPVFGGSPYMGMPQQNPVTIQPLAIVPYLNSQQPVYQYDPNQSRTMYRFVPDPVCEQEEEVNDSPLVFTPKKKEKKGGKRFLGFLQMILSALILFLAVFTPQFMTDYLGGGGEPFLQLKSLLEFDSLSFPSMLYPIFWTLVIVMAVASFIQGLVRLIRGKIAKAGWILGLLLFLFTVVVYLLPAFFLDNVVYFGAGTTFGNVTMLSIICMVASFIIAFASIIAAFARKK